MVQLVEAEVLVDPLRHPRQTSRNSESATVAPGVNVGVSSAGQRNAGSANHVLLEVELAAHLTLLLALAGRSGLLNRANCGSIIWTPGRFSQADSQVKKFTRNELKKLWGYFWRRQNYIKDNELWSIPGWRLFDTISADSLAVHSGKSLSLLRPT